MRFFTISTLLSMSITVASGATVDLTTQLQDLGSTSLLDGRPLSTTQFWRDKLWVFTATENSATPIVTYDPATATWARDEGYLDTEKVWDAYVQNGDLATNCEDEQWDDNRTSGYLRTDRGWHRFNVPGANAHQQGQRRLGKRWFAGSYTDNNVNARPWIQWSDDLGATSTAAPAGNLASNLVTTNAYDVAMFFEMRGNIFANGDSTTANVMHYTGSDADPFEVTYRDQTQWCAASLYTTMNQSVEFNGYLFGTMGHFGGWAAFRWTPEARSGAQGTYLAPGSAQFLAGPDWRPYYNLPPHPDVHRTVCGTFETKHGYLWAIYSDQGHINEPADLTNLYLGDYPVTLTISRSVDGENWDDIIRLVVGPGASQNLAQAYPGARLSVADNGDLYLQGSTGLYRLPAASYGGYTPPNHAPQAVADTFRTALDTSLNFQSGAEGVLANDRDVDHDDLQAALITGPTHGNLTFYPNGGFTYVPNTGFQGLDTFTYRISDGRDVSSAQSVTLVVGTPSVANSAPQVNAGADRTAESGVWVDLLATVTDDGLPLSGTLTQQWTLVSGPATPLFANVGNGVPSVQLGVPGVYVFRITASDGALTGSDEFSLTVPGTPPTNSAPVVDAGSNASATTNVALALNATVSDDGLPSNMLTRTWTKDSGPGTATFSDATAEDPSVTCTNAGTYVLRLTVSDGSLTAFDTVTVTVSAVPPTNTAPVVDAGTNASTTTDTALALNATVSDDGLPSNTLTRTWTKDSGPGTATFSDGTAEDPTVTCSSAGTYVLRLTVSDGSLTAFDTVTVTVAGASVNQAPLVSLHGTTRVLAGSVTDISVSLSDDGLPLGSHIQVTWTALGGEIIDQGSTARMSFARAGHYTVRATATDGALSTSDSLSIEVVDRDADLLIRDDESRCGLGGFTGFLLGFLVLCLGRRGRP